MHDLHLSQMLKFWDNINFELLIKIIKLKNEQ